MTRLIISDLHGRSVWKDMINRESPDMVIMLGDFIDSFDIPWDKQVANLFDILQYKKDHVNSCILLVGNHDLGYLGGDTNYSGYQSTYAPHYKSIYKELYENRQLQACYSFGNYLFSHAGITKQWVNKHIAQYNPFTIVNDINALLYEDIRAFDFQRNPKKLSYSQTGDDVWQSPTWVRHNSLKFAGIDGWNQIVGHTPMKKLAVEKVRTGETYFFCDTQDYSGEYLVFNDNDYEIKEL